MINLLIIEDDPMFRTLLEMYIKQNRRYDQIWSCKSIEAVESKCHLSSADLILIDVDTMVDLDGVEIVEFIKEQYSLIRMILLHRWTAYRFLYKAKRIGIESVWNKNSNMTELLDVIDRTFNGESVYPEPDQGIPFGNCLSTDITEREQEVLHYLLYGAADIEIAEKLHISGRTVKAHIQSMRIKTGFRNRTELAVRAKGYGFAVFKDK